MATVMRLTVKKEVINIQGTEIKNKSHTARLVRNMTVHVYLHIYMQERETELKYTEIYIGKN